MWVNVFGVEKEREQAFGGVWSEAHIGHLLMAKSAIVRNGSPDRGLFELHCTKKARD